MVQIDRAAPLRFLRRAFLPDDWIAVLLKSYDTDEALQRVGPVGMVLDARFQSWLRFKNAHSFNVFVSINALTPGWRSRTRESVSTVRHVFLDADREADRVLTAIEHRSDLPTPSCIVRSSEGRAHVLWRIDDISVEHAEVLQKHLARDLGTDMAATSAAQMTRLPGFFNHKYSPPQQVSFDHDASQRPYGPSDFPAQVVLKYLPPRLMRGARTRTCMPVTERARRYLAATPPAIHGQHGDDRTFRVCCRLVHDFGLNDAEALALLTDWNARCQPAWSSRDLAAKLRSARTS